MTRIIHLETATAVCSVATAEQGKPLVIQTLTEGFRHAENLMLLVEQVMHYSGWDFSSLDAIAVSAGPGSYTGLRIGVSAAKGLCYALEKPLIALSTLQTLATGFMRTHTHFNGLLCPMIDARRMEVYTALFAHDLERLTDDQPLIVDEKSLQSTLENQQVALFGDGALKCKELLGTSENAVFNLETELSAEDMTVAAFKKFRNGQFADLAYFEPEYLKPYQGTIPKVS